MEDGAATVSIDFKQVHCQKLEESLASAEPSEEGFIEFDRDEAEIIGATDSYSVSCRSFVEAQGKYFFDQS